jgi:hypothetical protein
MHRAWRILGYRDNLEPQRELIPNLPKDDDFFIKRLAAVEEIKGDDGVHS